MPPHDENCPICNKFPAPIATENATASYRACPRCGKYWLQGFSLHAKSVLEDLFLRHPKKEMHRRAVLSHLVRRQAGRYGDARVDPHQLTAATLDAPLPSPHELVDNLILLIGNCQEGDYLSLADLTRRGLPAMLGFPLEEPDGKGLDWFLTQVPGNLYEELPWVFDDQFLCRLTLPGWQRFHVLQNATGTLRQAFMAMQFNDLELNRVVEDCFKPAAARAGYRLRLVTDEQPAGVIDDQMRTSLRTCRFAIADLTHQNRGAYWEAGFAEGLGRPVIYTCRRDVWEDPNNKPHFDTNHLATVIWDPTALADAEHRLVNMIRATLPGEAKLTD